MIPTLWWACGSSTGTTAILPGDQVFVHGKDFAYSWLYLRGPQEGFIPFTSVTPGEITFAMPAWPLGTYDFWINTGIWIKAPWQLTLTTGIQAKIASVNKAIAAPPSGGDDTAFLQSIINKFPNDGTGGDIQLQAGTYQLSTDLQVVAGFGGPVSLNGVSRMETIIEPVSGGGNFGDAFMAGGQIRQMKVDAQGANLANKRALRVPRAIDCNILTDPGIQSFFMDGGDSGNLYLSDCAITGQGVFAGSPKTVFVDGCGFYLDGLTDAGLVLWNTAGVHVTNCTAEDRAEHNEQRGRILVLASGGHDIYLGGLQTFSLAGSAADPNCGEQILGDGTNLIERVFISGCHLQGRKDMTTGASCGVEFFCPTADLHVENLIVEDCVYGANIFGGQGTWNNVKVTNCRRGLRVVGATKTTFTKLSATGCIEHALDIDGTGLVLQDSNLTDAPIGIWSQGNAGNVLLSNSQITLGKGLFAGSHGLDPSASRVIVMLNKMGSVRGFEAGNISGLPEAPPRDK